MLIKQIPKQVRNDKLLIAPNMTLGLSGRAKAMGLLGKKEGRTVCNSKLVCCNREIKNGALWFLKDFKGFTGRKLYVGQCNICGDDVALQIMTNVKTGKRYYNLYTGIEAVKTIYREKKRLITKFADIPSEHISGWIYGVNKEIKNRKGQVTQIRQYAYDYSASKSKGLVKQIKLS